jgi:hypothetical protein
MVGILGRSFLLLKKQEKSQCIISVDLPKKVTRAIGA